MTGLYIGIRADTDWEGNPTGLSVLRFEKSDWLCGVQVLMDEKELLELQEKIKDYIEKHRARRQ